MIIRKSIWWIVIIFILALFSAFAFLRYTPPIYQSNSILQINEQNQTAEILGFKNNFIKPSELPAVMELIRSNEFLKRVFVKLPFEISYFSQGTFLSTETYRTSSYIIEVRNVEPEMYNNQIYISFLNKNSFTLEYYINGVKSHYSLKPDRWNKINKTEIKYCNLPPTFFLVS